MPFIVGKPKVLYWTNHSRLKMRFYGLSEQRVARILHMPTRVEEGIAPKTVAYMQLAGSKKHPYELWTMIQDAKTRRKVISAWRYPGRTKPRSEVVAGLIRQAYSDYMETATGEQ
jgi:hypothetical protein